MGYDDACPGRECRTVERHSWEFILARDTRYAWIPFYRRNYGDAFGQIIVVVVQNRNRSRLKPPTTRPTSLRLGSPPIHMMLATRFWTEAARCLFRYRPTIQIMLLWPAFGGPRVRGFDLICFAIARSRLSSRQSWRIRWLRVGNLHHARAGDSRAQAVERKILVRRPGRHRRDDPRHSHVFRRCIRHNGNKRPDHPGCVQSRGGGRVCHCIRRHQHRRQWKCWNGNRLHLRLGRNIASADHGDMGDYAGQRHETVDLHVWQYFFFRHVHTMPNACSVFIIGRAYPDPTRPNSGLPVYDGSAWM